VRRVLPLLVSILFLAPQLHAADLTKIERTIRKEPAYQSKTPRYCLLVFGPEAKTRVWLVLDGKTLYVDRNGNGDLTEDGEKVSSTKEGQTILGEDVYTFAVGELRDGERRHRNVTLIVIGLSSESKTKTAVDNNAPSLSFRIRMEVEIPGFEGVTKDSRVLQAAGLDASPLQFADRPREAPILHFAGPLTLTVSGQPTFRINREMELYLGLETPGRGEGTFVHTASEGAVPPAVYPRAEIAFPAQKPGEPPVKAIFELKGRC
jgi:hypothetical protein